MDTVSEVVNIIGYLRTDHSETIREQAKIVANFLLINGYGLDNIISIIKDLPPNQVTIDGLPDTLWHGSILKKNTFYFHPELQIKENGVIYDEKTHQYTTRPYSLEMKIMYTRHDAIRYFYKKAKTVDSMQDFNRDIGACNYFFNKYKKIVICKTSVEPIDLLLYLIDYAVSTKDNLKYASLIDITNKYFNVGYEAFEKYIMHYVYNQMNHIVHKGERK